MKTFCLLALALALAANAPAQPRPLPPNPPPPMATETLKEAVNYSIRVEWNNGKTNTQHLQILTAEGSFNLDSIQKASVKINNNDIPITLRMSGALGVIDQKKGRLQLFLGRTIPYVTSTYNSPSGQNSSYSQMSTGINNTYIVKFGQPLTIQSDENGDIVVTVKRVDD